MGLFGDAGSMSRMRLNYAWLIWLLAGLLCLNGLITLRNMRDIASVDEVRDHAVERLRDLRALRHSMLGAVEPNPPQLTTEVMRDRYLDAIDKRIGREPPESHSIEGMREARRIMAASVGRPWIEVVRDMSIVLDPMYESDKLEVDGYRDSAQRLGIRDAQLLLITEVVAVIGLVAAGWLVRRELRRRDRVEHKLIASQARLAEAEKLAKLGYWERDLRTGQITWSPELCSIFGLSFESTRQIPTHPDADGGLGLYIECIHPDDRVRVKGAIDRATLSGESYSESYRLGKDGASRTIFEQGRVLKDGDGRPRRLFVTAQDVTALDEAQRAIRTSEARFRALCDSANVAIVNSDANGAVVYLSPRWTQITGYSAQDTEGFAWHTMIHPADRDEVVSSWADSTANGKPWTHEHRIVTRSGATKWVRVLAGPIHNVDGKVKGYVSTVEDVTERHENARRERESQARFAAVIKASNQLLYDWDTATGRITVEDNCNNVVGIDPNQLTTADEWAARVHPEDRPALLSEFARVIKAREPFDLEYRMARSDGTYIPVHDRGHFVEHSGQSSHVLGLVSDLTHQKKLEAELLQAQKMESIGRLAGGIAHDFNNWLTVIIGHVALARAAMDEPEGVRHGLDQIEAAAESSAQLTRQLVSFARRQVVEQQICSMNELSKRSAKVLDRVLGDDIELVIRPDPDLWPVRIDPSQFEQVLLNLTVNARDAMPKGGRLTIETQNVTLDDAYVREHIEATPGEYACLIVTDTGEGIPESIRQKLFEPFFTTKELGKGTGMGLPTCLGIVKQSGGHIYVYSEVGRGTSFKVYLPRAVGTPTPRKATPPTAPVRGGNETVLVVEDQAMIRELVERILTDAGYRVAVARDGDEARRLVSSRGFTPHILVTDVVLPGISGTELAAILRASNPTLRVLFSSGYTDHTAGLEPGVNFLQKPYSPSLLLQRVREVLDRPTDAHPPHFAPQSPHPTPPQTPSSIADPQ